jgi:hypothetical protein
MGPVRVAGVVVVVQEDEREVARWPVAVSSGRADLADVDVVARLLLAARRLGCGVRLVAASDELLELLELAGLCGREVLRQAVRDEQPALHVEEVVEADDPLR